MSRVLVKLRVNRATYEDIYRRLIEADHSRVMRGGFLNLDEVAIEVDPQEAPHAHWGCCGYPRSGGHNSSCTFYGLDEKPKERGDNDQTRAHHRRVSRQKSRL